jgi:hypothetical protein
VKHKKKNKQEEEQGRKRRKRHGDRVGVDDRRSPLEALHSRLQCRHRSCIQRGRKLCQPVHTIHLGIHPLHHFQSAATSASKENPISPFSFFMPRLLGRSRFQRNQAQRSKRKCKKLQHCACCKLIKPKTTYAGRPALSSF